MVKVFAHHTEDSGSTNHMGSVSDANFWCPPIRYGWNTACTCVFVRPLARMCVFMFVCSSVASVLEKVCVFVAVCACVCACDRLCV